MAALLREVIGDVLRRARVEQGRTLREVSDSARVSLGYLSEVERGRKEASSELLSAICNALDVPLSRVLSEAGGELAVSESRAAAAVPSGPPAAVPSGPPAAVPSGPPAAVPSGPPAAVPSGPPAAAPNIDVTTKVVIPQVVSMAVA